LSFHSYEAIAAASAEEDCWISAFSRVVHLKLNTPVAPVLLTPSQIFDLIRSFPLLEDLSMTVLDYGTINSDYRFEQSTVILPSSSPTLTGSLELIAQVGMDPFVSPLLSLPNGLHFRNLDLNWHRVADVSSTTELVEGCCSTLESLKINSGLLSTSVWHPYQHQ
jgi:hypothetical protein